VLAELVVLRALRGEFERAGESLAALIELRPKGNVHWPSAEATAEAALAWARGDLAEIRRVVELFNLMWQSDPGFDIPRFLYAIRAEADFALQARAAGDEGAARDAVSQARAVLERVQEAAAPDARPLGHIPEEQVLMVEQCGLEAKRASGETDADAWAAHADRWQDLGRPFEAAYAQLRAAEAALTENLPRERIVEPLAAARATATRLGARPVLDRIETVARRARVRAAPQEGEAIPDEVAGLTSRELDVLRLIAAGRTNPEIGQALYMSPKTASVHVSRILSKLDVKTRTEAAGVAHRLGLLEVE
jgi:ATP/maltotriose-dependent transcriptional regulator MalT